MITANYLLQVVTKKSKNFRTFEKLIKYLLHRNMVIDETEIKENEYVEKLDKLRAYSEKGSKYIDLKESVSKNVKDFYDGWEKIIYGFRNGTLPLSKIDDMKTESGDQEPDILETTKQKNLIVFRTN